ncbi:hypothetical protein FJZ48_02030 [Candidatus Uhrbacteria bacterium]|nr:hypothetical protein [Candidatus Uhrbacteria bacterium]
MDTESLLFTKVFDVLNRAQKVLIVSDGSPDGDSLGASSAILNWLLREGKVVRAFSKEIVPRTLFYLDGIHLFTNDPKLFEESYDVIMTFDTGSLRRCGIDLLLPKTPKGYVLINFDHHATNEKFGDINVVMTDASSTAEMVYRFCEINRIPLDSLMGTSILSGIWTDTTHFTNSGTTIKSLEAASACFAAGARFSDVLKYIVKDKSLPALKLMGIALSHLQKHETYNLIHTYFLERDLANIPHANEHMEWIVNFLYSVCSDTDTILVIRETPDGFIKGSLRSVGRDISRVAKLLGGGGHKKAAGFMIKGTLKIKDGKASVSTL